MTELGLKIDQVLIEEYKTLLSYTTQTESILVAWERVFLVTNGFILAASTTVAANAERFPGSGAPTLISLLAVAGVCISVFWLLLTSRTYAFIGVRETRLAEIEQQLGSLHTEHAVFTLAALQKTRIRDNTELPFTMRFSAIRVRRAYPYLMIFLNALVGVLLVSTVIWSSRGDAYQSDSSPSQLRILFEPAKNPADSSRVLEVHVDDPDLTRDIAESLRILIEGQKEPDPKPAALASPDATDRPVDELPPANAAQQAGEPAVE